MQCFCDVMYPEKKSGKKPLRVKSYQRCIIVFDEKLLSICLNNCCLPFVHYTAFGLGYQRTGRNIQIHFQVADDVLHLKANRNP